MLTILDVLVRAASVVFLFGRGDCARRRAIGMKPWDYTSECEDNLAGRAGMGWE